MRGLRAALLLLALLVAPASLLAQALPLSSLSATPAPQISLITFAPGEVYWQRFGHNALLVREAGAERLYNYGIFDFQQKNFFLNFARGRMLYRLDEAPLDHALRSYVAEGRWVLEQRLALSDAQARALAAFLTWNARPENADYRYDYFLANCSTRVRDALDRALGGTLRAQLVARAGSDTTFRSEVLRLMAPMPALMLGMDLGLGARVDAPLDAWQEGFIPMRLAHALRAARIIENGSARPLIAGERALTAQPVDERATASAPLPLLPMFALGLAGAALLGGLRALRRSVRARVAFGLASGLLALVFGIMGTVLLLGWLATEHWGMAANHNLLLLSPLWWVLLPTLLRQLRHRPRRNGSFVRLLAAAMALAALAALPLALAGSQPNLHWVALLLPPQLVLLAACIGRGGARDGLA